MGRPEPVVCPVVRPAELDGIERDVTGNHHHQQCADGVDDAARPGRQHIDEKRDAEIFAAGQRAGRAEETRSDHQAAGDVVGPFDRCVEQRAQQHRAADDQKVGCEQDGRCRVTDREQGSDSRWPLPGSGATPDIASASGLGRADHVHHRLGFRDAP